MGERLDELKLELENAAALHPDLAGLLNRCKEALESLELALGMDSPRIIGAAPRSPEWPKVRRRVIEKHPTCAATGVTRDLEAHHIIPFHEDPKLELDEKNLIVLSRIPHFLIGHLGSWNSHNPNVVEDANWLLRKIKSRP